MGLLFLRVALISQDWRPGLFSLLPGGRKGFSIFDFRFSIFDVIFDFGFLICLEFGAWNLEFSAWCLGFHTFTGTLLYRLFSMKKIITICLILVAFQSEASTVRIDFVRGCPEEFDVFFKKGLESLGYEVFVNYYNRLDQKTYDYLFTYEWADPLLRISFRDKQNQTIRSGEKSLIYRDRIESVIYMFMSDVFERMIRVKDPRGRITGLVRNQMIKLDSSVYIARMIAGDTGTAKENFLRVAGELTGSFRTYFDFTYDQHYFMSGLVHMPSCKCTAFGIVIGTRGDPREREILDRPPPEFSAYLDEQLKDTPLPPDIPGKDTLACIYVIRSTLMFEGVSPYRIFIDGDKVCYIDNDEYARFYVAPGKHEFVVSGTADKIHENAKVLHLALEPGEKVFINLILDVHRDVGYYFETDYSGRLKIKNLVFSDCDS